VSGSAVGRGTSRRAPVLEKFRTTQLIRLAPRQVMTAVWEEAARVRFLRSFIGHSCAKCRITPDYAVLVSRCLMGPTGLLTIAVAAPATGFARRTKVSEVVERSPRES
jgi:hypothetical protein